MFWRAAEPANVHRFPFPQRTSSHDNIVDFSAMETKEFHGEAERSRVPSPRGRGLGRGVSSIHSTPHLCPLPRGEERSLRHRNLIAEVHILNSVQDCDAFFEWLLECLATRDQSSTSSALVDDGRHHRLLQIVVAAGASAVDESNASHVAVCDLVACEVDRVIGREFFVDALVGFAIAAFFFFISISFFFAAICFSFIIFIFLTSASFFFFAAICFSFSFIAAVNLALVFV